MALYFAGIVAPAEINTKALKWKRYMLDNFGCRVALRSPAHITLIPPFRVAPDEEGKLIDLLAVFAGTQQPFPVTLRGFSSFAPRVIFVHVEPSAELEALQKRMEAYMISAQLPVKASTRPFHPHVTIANRDLRKSDYRAAFDHFGPKRYSASFEVDAFHLLRSEKEGWTVVAGFPFGT